MQEATGEETEAEPGRIGPGPAGLGRPAQPTPGLVRRPSVRLFTASTTVGRHIEQIILPTPFNRKPPPQDEGES
jgi:hypothetical protein